MILETSDWIFSVLSFDKLTFNKLMSMLRLIEHIKNVVWLLDHLENLVLLMEIKIKIHKLLSNYCQFNIKPYLTDYVLTYSWILIMTHMNM